MMSFVLALALTQDGTWVETRFHRVHLRNGNFIDGLLVRESPRDLFLEVKKAGEFGVRRDMVSRVEFIKMRSLAVLPEAPPDVKPPADTRPAPAVPGPKAPVASENVPTRFSEETRRAVDTLLVAYASSNSETRRPLAPSLQQLGAEAVGYACWLAVSGTPAAERADLVAAIGVCESPDVLPALLAIAKSSTDSFSRGAALKALSRKNTPAGDALIVEGLGDSSGQVWREALEETIALHKNGRIKVEDIIARMQASPNKEIFMTALSKIGVEAGLKAIEEILKEGSSADRKFAVRALSSHKGRVDAGAIAIGLLEDPDVELQREICLYLGKARIKPAVRALLTALADEDNAVSGNALWSLREITGNTYPRDVELWTRWWEKGGKDLFPEVPKEE